MVILDLILGYKSNWDKKLTDPVWTSVSLKLKKVYTLPKYRCISLQKNTEGK